MVIANIRSATTGVSFLWSFGFCSVERAASLGPRHRHICLCPRCGFRVGGLFRVDGRDQAGVAAHCNYVMAKSDQMDGERVVLTVELLGQCRGTDKEFDAGGIARRASEIEALGAAHE